MPHVRQQIRDAVRSALTGLATTGSNVLIGRTRPLSRDHEPTLLIFTTNIAAASENARPFNTASPRTLIRSLILSIEGRVQAQEPPDDTLDDIAAEVEAAMAADITFGKLVKTSELQSTISDVSAEGDRHAGAIRLQYAVTYSTRETAPETAA